MPNVYGADCIYWMPSKKNDLESYCEHYDMLTDKCEYWLKGGDCQSEGLIHKSVEGDGLVLQ